MITPIRFFTAWVAAHVKDDRGASLVEYALLVALIAANAFGWAWLGYRRQLRHTLGATQEPTPQ